MHYLISVPQDISELRAISIILILKQLILDKSNINIKESEQYISALIDLGMMKINEFENSPKKEKLVYHSEFLYLLTEAIWIVVEKAYNLTPTQSDISKPYKKIVYEGYQNLLCFTMASITKNIYTLLMRILTSQFGDSNLKLVSNLQIEEADKVINKAKIFCLQTIILMSVSIVEIKIRFSESFVNSEGTLILEYITIIQDILKFLIFETHQSILTSITLGINLNDMVIYFYSRNN